MERKKEDSSKKKFFLIAALSVLAALAVAAGIGGTYAAFSHNAEAHSSAHAGGQVNS